MLTGDERALLRRLGGWPIADLLLDPERGAEHLRSSMWGGSYGDGSWFQCERRGIEVYTYAVPDADFDTEAMQAASLDKSEAALGRRTILLLPWTQIASYAAKLPDSIRSELRAARRHYTAVNRAYTEATHQQPWEKRRLFNEELWEAHMAEYWPARERLEAALAAALSDCEPEQLDMFATADGAA